MKILRCLSSLVFLGLLSCARTESHMPLPHNELYNDLSPEDAILALGLAKDGLVPLAVSGGFWDEDSDFEEIHEAYGRYFEKKKTEFSRMLGTPIFEGNWLDDDYPSWAIGSEICAWQGPKGAIYLRLEHEDQESSIEVSLLTQGSIFSNHDPAGYYDVLREQVKAEAAKVVK